MKSSFTRKEFYDLVWSTPMIRLAKQLNYSDNGLRKICKKHNIPIPKLGYWQKVKHKKAVKKIALPPGNSSIKIMLSSASDPIHYNQGNKRPIDPVIENVINSEKTLNLDDLPDHPVVSIARKHYAAKLKERYYKRSEMKLFRSDFISFYASDEMVPRIINFYNRLIHLLIKMGHTLSSKADGNVILIKGVPMEFHCREKQKRIKQDGNYTSDLYPTGILAFEGGPGNKHRIWNDGRIKIEERVGEIITYLEFKAYDTLRSEYRNKIAKRLRDIRKAEEWREHEEEVWEEEKSKMLIDDAFRMYKYQSLNLLLDKAQVEMNNPTEEQLKWLKWAKERLDELNPFGHGFDRFVNRYLGPAPSIPQNSSYDYGWLNKHEERVKNDAWWPGKKWYS